MPVKPKTFFLNEEHEVPRNQREFKKAVLLEELRIVRESNKKLRVEVDDLHKTRDAASFSEVKKIQALTKLCHRSEVVLSSLVDALCEVNGHSAPLVLGRTHQKDLQLILAMVTFLVQDLKEAM